jgi:glucose/mannose-6-phosphate isomerase
MLADVLDQPSQMEDALWRAQSAGVPEVDAPAGLVVCGMGGSAIGGDLARACLGPRARRPILVTRGFAPEPWIGPHTLVLLASYSGETAETLACQEAARAAGARRVAVTTGGPLAEAARADGDPVIGVPSGLQPRAAVAYMTVAALECAAACGAAPSLGDEIEAAGRLLEELAAEWGPDGPDDSEPKALARSLRDRIAMVYGGGPTVAVARRWKSQLNENAKVPAFHSELPEADHNEICGFEVARELAPLQAVMLLDRSQDRRVAHRLAVTGRVAREVGAGGDEIHARGETPVERVASLVFLGDLVSVYLATLRGVDPTPVAAIVDLKRSLNGA